MKCPQCQHIVHEDGGKCPNCGEDFELMADVEGATALDSSAEVEALGPLGDLPLNVSGTLPVAADSESVVRQTTSKAVRSGLPLFPFPQEWSRELAVASSARDSESIITKLKIESSRSAEGADSFEFCLDDGVKDFIKIESSAAYSVGRLLVRRLGAGLLDLILLLGIDAAVIYLTMRLTGAPLSAPHWLPVAPLATFLALLNLGYVISLTALGGQTIGKMAGGLRVVTEAGTSVTLVQSIKRTAGYAISVLPAGVGFAGLFFAQRVALHDLLAHTRVVKLS